MTFYDLFGTATSRPGSSPRGAVDPDEETVVASENRNSMERELREICLKWVFPLTGDKRKAIQGHFNMLGMMMKAYPDLVVIDNKAREHVEKKTMKTTEQHRPFEFFPDLRSRSHRSLVCIHRIRTSTSLAELKEAWGVLDELKKQKAYVRTHAFGEKDREISHIGFIPGVNMMNISKEVVEDEILGMIKRTNAEVPNFEIVQVGVDMGKGSKLSERTRAYEIQCPQRNASSLAKMLQSGAFIDHPVYVPYRMKQSNPEVFKQAIKRQIKILAEQWVIKLQGFTPDMIAFTRDKVLESWAVGIVPTKNTALGEWKILVDKNSFKHTVAWLREHWVEIMELIPPEVVESSPFLDPNVASKIGTPMDTASEEGTVDTYGTILSSLYYGNESDLDVQSEASESEEIIPASGPVRLPSYAQVARGTPSTVSQISGWTDRRQEEFHQLHEQNSDLHDKFNQVSEELSELKALIRQLLSKEPSGCREQSPAKKQAIFESPDRSERRKQREVVDAMETEFGSTNNDPKAGNLQRMQE